MTPSPHDVSGGLPFWLDFERPAFPRLDGDHTADVAIVGAGISGLKLAHCLARHGVKTVILEGGRVGDGASGRNQGSMCHGAGMLYQECIREFEKQGTGGESRRMARDLWRLGLENHRLAHSQIEEYTIACDYEKSGFHTLVRRDVGGCEATLASYHEDCRLMREDGFRVATLDETEARRMGGNGIYMGGYSYLDDAQFHSGRYTAGLALGISRKPGIALFERSRVEAIEPDSSRVRLATATGTVRAAHVFLVTNALAPQHVPVLETSLRAERGQVFVTEPLPAAPCRGSFATTMAWWREIPERGGWRLLFGGGRRRDEPDSLFRQFDASGRPHPKLEGEGSRPTEGHQRRLDNEFAKLFPSLVNARITHRWGGLQCFTADHLPVIGAFDPSRRIHGMAGFSGRGNTYADVGAEILTARLLGKACEIQTRYGALMDRIMAVGRASAKWGGWTTSNG